MIKSSLLIFALIAFTTCHPTVHDNFPRREECLTENPPTPYSWHFHIVYDHKQREEALAFRQIIANFLGIDLNNRSNICQDLIYLQGQDLCFFDPVEEPDQGYPFMQAEWAVLFLPKDFYRIVTFGLLNKGDLDAVIHPNTGCDISDHTFYVLYAGNKRVLDPTIFGGERGIIKKGDTTFKPVDDIESALNNPNISDEVKQFLIKHAKHFSKEFK